MKYSTESPPEATNQLTTAEDARLAELEAVVDANLASFQTAGKALTEIRASKLYRGTNETFEGYCRVRFGIERRHAYRLMDAVSVIENVSNLDTLPASESQARPLTGLPADEQRAAWAEAVETAPEGKVTAKHVAEVVARRTVVRNGTAYTMNTSKIGKKPTAAVEEGVIDDDESKPVDQMGNPITDPEIAAAFASRKLFTSLMRDISLLKGRFEEIGKQAGGPWVARRIKQFDADVNSLNSSVRFSIPHAICPYCAGAKCTQCKRTGWLPEDVYKAVPAEIRGQGVASAT